LFHFCARMGHAWWPLRHLPPHFSRRAPASPEEVALIVVIAFFSPAIAALIAWPAVMPVAAAVDPPHDGAVLPYPF
jgi:hypothetical protein